MEPKALCMMGKHSANGATTPAQDSFFFSNFFFFFAYHLALTEGILEKTNFLLVKISSLCWKYSCACQEYVLPQQVLSWELMFSQMKLLCLLSVSLSDDDQQVKGHVCSRNKWGWSLFLFWLLLFAFPGFKVVTQKIRHMWQFGPILYCLWLCLGRDFVQKCGWEEKFESHNESCRQIYHFWAFPVIFLHSRWSQP